jgi:hypothetical protein
VHLLAEKGEDDEVETSKLCRKGFSVYSFPPAQFVLNFSFMCNLYSVTTDQAAIIAMGRDFRFGSESEMQNRAEVVRFPFVS